MRARPKFNTSFGTPVDVSSAERRERRPNRPMLCLFVISQMLVCFFLTFRYFTTSGTALTDMYSVTDYNAYSCLRKWERVLAA